MSRGNPCSVAELGYFVHVENMEWNLIITRLRPGWRLVELIKNFTCFGDIEDSFMFTMGIGLRFYGRGVQVSKIDFITNFF